MKIWKLSINKIEQMLHDDGYNISDFTKEDIEDIKEASKTGTLIWHKKHIIICSLAVNKTFFPDINDELEEA